MINTELLELEVGNPANGGICVARYEGRVVFVRGALPGETVLARLEGEVAAKQKFWRAQCVEVIVANPARKQSIWPEAGVDGVGGADFAHVALDYQREMKSIVFRDLMQRAKLETVEFETLEVQAVPNDDGLNWRTRVQFAVDVDGNIGMKGWRSHEVHPVGKNPLAAENINRLELERMNVPALIENIEVAAPAYGGEVAVVLRARRGVKTAEVIKQFTIPESWDSLPFKVNVLVQGRDGYRVLAGVDFLHEYVDVDTYRVHAAGFWQVHRQAPELLRQQALEALDPKAGDVAWDLFSGAGLFTVPLARAVGDKGFVLAMEGGVRAAKDAVMNLEPFSNTQVLAGDCAASVRRVLNSAGNAVDVQTGYENQSIANAGKLGHQVKRGRGNDHLQVVHPLAAHPDLVLVDPPRAGVGIELMKTLLQHTGKRLVYVSCDAATLARDLKVAESVGWRVKNLQAYDLFPYTHHFESICVLEPSH